MQFQESTWTPDGVHQNAWLSVTTSYGQLIRIANLSQGSDGNMLECVLADLCAMEKLFYGFIHF